MKDFKHFKGSVSIPYASRKMSKAELERIKKDPKYKWMFDLWEKLENERGAKS